MKVYIQNKDFALKTDIFIVRDDHNGQRWIAKPMVLEWVKHEHGISEDPSLSIHQNVEGEFLKALTDAISEKGIKPESDSKLEGKLIATEKHLEDMRTLVFKKTK